LSQPIPKLPALFAISIALTGCYCLAWLAASFGFLGEAHIGYYGDFFFVKHALEKTGCVDSMEYSRHEDRTLEDFHFKVRTKSGRLVRVWFNSDQDVGSVCRTPQGLLIAHPHALDQRYDIDAILKRLSGRGIKKADLQAILCNIDELARLFDQNYDSGAIPTVGWEPGRDRQFSRYLRLEVVDESINNGGWIETPIVYTTPGSRILE
jgi:hypothetical protein